MNYKCIEEFVYKNILKGYEFYGYQRTGPDLRRRKWDHWPKGHKNKQVTTGKMKTIIQLWMIKKKNSQKIVFCFRNICWYI